MIQVVLAAAVALGVSLLGTPLLISVLRRHRLAQAIRVSKDGIQYPEHEGKKGTPSMGGLAVIIAVLLGYAVAHLAVWRPPTVSGLLALYLTVGLGLVGMVDDYLKIFKQRSTGVRARTKLGGQAFIAITFAIMALSFPDEFGRTPASQAISFVRDTPIVLPIALAVLWIWLLITATTNAVNLTDGLDGLAAGAAVATFAAFALLGVWQYGQNCAFTRFERCYEVRDPLDLAVFAAACAGACVGFLWWNTSPAQIFMGDTGSLAIGGAIAALAIFSQTELLLVLLGGLFLLTTVSVILQVASFKLTGKRVFRMAPLHHHFELKGWGEVTIVTRFWILQGLFVGLGLSLFYAEWVRT
ncbi:MAG: phospho-N-acetylmuramoyl-pentapeptide-transferase [Actinobacteria bacterium]|nr:phospho-N-acetylmuramoyl-pentapeptide-transferase [Actinomycetota bacterium]MCB9412302.1 phospho-N-acetylmuramoyl-pentapeptide-transferase [Actinomycetota bacterium]